MKISNIKIIVLKRAKSFAGTTDMKSIPTLKRASNAFAEPRPVVAVLDKNIHVFHLLISQLPVQLTHFFISTLFTVKFKKHGN